MDQPNWAVVLHYLHGLEGVAQIEYPKDGKILESHPVVKDNPSLSRTQAEDAIEYLIHTGLLIEAEKNSHYAISERGFDAVHQRQLEARSWDASYASVFLTFGLVTATIAGLMMKELNGWWRIFGLVGILVVFLPGMVYLVKRISIQDTFW